MNILGPSWIKKRRLTSRLFTLSIQKLLFDTSMLSSRVKRI